MRACRRSRIAQQLRAIATHGTIVDAISMVSQLRIYQIKPALIFEWLDLFFGTLIGLHELVGITVSAAWRNPAKPNEFVWIREFKSAESVEGQEREFFSTPQRLALGDVKGRYVEQFEVRVLKPLAIHAEGGSKDR